VLPGSVMLLAKIFAEPSTPQSAPKLLVDAILHVHWKVGI
jgi:hypothetical protein